MKIIIIYDNNISKNEIISDIIGEKTFADIIINKEKIEITTKNKMTKLYPNCIWKKINSISDYKDLLIFLEQFKEEDTKILHFFSNFYIQNLKKIFTTYNKILKFKKSYKLFVNNKIANLFFYDKTEYTQFCKNIILNLSKDKAIENIEESYTIDGLIDLSQIDDFIECITQNIESRYFNYFEKDKYTITKFSTNKLKIKKEYDYIQLIPDKMKIWFVTPFNYQENEATASYTMERLYLTDLSIKWVYGSMSENDFNTILDKYFYFFRNRPTKNCSKIIYKQQNNELYIKKLFNRIDELKKLPQYKHINDQLLLNNIDIDELVKQYLVLKEKIESKQTFPLIQVIGHGDAIFSNTLYNKSTQIMKFIDPKGALNEKELWTNPYYDIAKLSHCICGKYDFFNNDLYEINQNKNLELKINIPTDYEKYIKIFKEKLKDNNIDYNTIRIYEASLFLSMLPLHIDNPHKVLGFILNAQKILMEIEKDV